MNIKNIFYELLGFSLMFSACTSEEVDVVSPSTNTTGVHLRLTGAAAAKVTSRATVAAEDGEKIVNNLFAVLFDTHEGFYKTVPATRVGDTNEYTFIVEKDATYDIWLVANASDELKTALENIPAGTPFENSEMGENCLNSIIADQAPDAEANFLMVSKYSEKITTRITESQSIGEVHMIRLAARFDLLNKAENVTVTSISFANRTVKSAVLTPNTASTIVDWYESKDYEVNVAGEPENGKEWNGQIYTYENYSTEYNKPELTISYYEGENSEDVKTHVVKLIDPNSTEGTNRPIKRNNLYRIVLTKATKLAFDLQVLDWDDEEAEIEHPEVPLILPKDVQDSLNRQLLVYDLFTEYNVKSIDFDNKTVEFYDTYEYLTTPAYSFNELNDKGLMGADVVLTDKDGNKYRFPTAGDLQLMTTMHGNVVSVPFSPYNNNRTVSFITNSSREEFSEVVYLKNNADNTILRTEDITEENEFGFTGMSYIANGRNSKIYGLTSENRYTDVPELMNERIVQYPIYGVRFKGTNQYAAYKWENVSINDGKVHGISIKIKALPDSQLTLEETMNDIINNHSYWADDECINIFVPISGGTTDMGKTLFMSSKGLRLNANAKDFGITNVAFTTALPIRLVKVKETKSEDAEL